MVLTDVDIKKAIRDGYIEISDFNEKMLGPNSYDLRLGDTLMTYTEKHLSVKEENPTVKWKIPRDGYLLKPGELYLGVTKEFTNSRIHVPLIEGKSSIGRLGLSVHVTAGFGDIGFKGHWTLEMTVVKPLMVYADMPICQIYFMLSLGVCARPYSLKGDAKYHNQPGEPVPSMMWKNFLQTSSIV